MTNYDVQQRILRSAVETPEVPEALPALRTFATQLGEAIRDCDTGHMGLRDEFMVPIYLGALETLGEPVPNGDAFLNLIVSRWKPRQPDTVTLRDGTELSISPVVREALNAAGRLSVYGAPSAEYGFGVIRGKGSEESDLAQHGFTNSILQLAKTLTIASSENGTFRIAADPQNIFGGAPWKEGWIAFASNHGYARFNETCTFYLWKDSLPLELRSLTNEVVPVRNANFHDISAAMSISGLLIARLLLSCSPEQQKQLQFKSLEVDSESR